MQPYVYHLPPHLIAQKAAEPRDSARLLRWPEAAETPFSALPDFVTPGDVLVVNESKVIPARLYGTRPARATGGATAGVQVEFLLHRPLDTTLTRWSTFAKPARRLKAGDVVHLHGDAEATVEEAGANPVIRLHLAPEAVPTYLETHGHTPLPPYIHAEDTPQTRARYQTVYANPQQPGSVAAPTAGLHFTPAVLDTLQAKGVQVLPVTLHVGAGTFLNPTPEQIAKGELHAEWAHVPAATATAILAAQQRGANIIPVGTTALRTLETWAKFGMSPAGFMGDTTLFIQPGFAFKVATRLVTNFHLPGSSLLMLVAAFIGEGALEELYAHAIAQQFRFYSFGDSSLLTRKA
jgi:S-adenosylmethionine:tRNA ribosyltransferase-isomerase